MFKIIYFLINFRTWILKKTQNNSMIWEFKFSHKVTETKATPYRTANSPSATGSFPVLIEFSRSPGLLSFSSGIVYSFLQNNLWSKYCFIWFPMIIFFGIFYYSYYIRFRKTLHNQKILNGTSSYRIREFFYTLAVTIYSTNVMSKW